MDSEAEKRIVSALLSISPEYFVLYMNSAYFRATVLQTVHMCDLLLLAASQRAEEIDAEQAKAIAMLSRTTSFVVPGSLLGDDR